MTEPISVEEFLKRSVTTPVADVRTPAEYEKGHIPRAVLFSLFNDRERAEVGTLYVQQGRTAAVLKGLELTGPRLGAMARRGLEIARGGAAAAEGSDAGGSAAGGSAAGGSAAGGPAAATEGSAAGPRSSGAAGESFAGSGSSAAASGSSAAESGSSAAESGSSTARSESSAAASGSSAAESGSSAARSGSSLLLYCWRGGMRSASVAWLMESVGVRCFTLENGYKAYRNHLLGFFEHLPHPLKVLGGLTGSGKTERLHLMAEAGEQVIDLEGLAGHKGSAFGNLGLPPQPSTEHFQNMLYDAFSHMDPARPVWVEDESRNIGRCSLPDGLWDKMQQARFYLLDTPLEERVERLMREYGNFDPDMLETAILKIQKRLGYDMSKKAVEACRCGNIRTALEICLAYYDKAYTYQLETRKKNYGIHTFDTI